MTRLHPRAGALAARRRACYPIGALSRRPRGRARWRRSARCTAQASWRSPTTASRHGRGADAARARVRAAVRPADHRPRRGRRTLLRRASMNEGPTALRLGLRGQAGGRRGGHGRARHRARRGDRRRACTWRTCSTARRRRADPAARARGIDVTRRGHAAPFDAHRRGGRRLRHQHEDGAAAAHGGRLAGAAATASPTARSTRSPPITRRTTRTRRTSSSTQAAFGIVGLETALGLGLKLVRRGRARSADAGRAHEPRDPARILGSPAGTLDVGAPARRDARRSRAALEGDPARGFTSKSRNTPFDGLGAHGPRGRRPGRAGGWCSTIGPRRRRCGGVVTRHRATPAPSSRSPTAPCSAAAPSAPSARHRARSCSTPA